MELGKVFNIREGLGRRTGDSLPPRLLDTPLPEGGSRERTVFLKTMLEEYYDLRGWNDREVPLEIKIEELGLSR